MTLSYVRPLWSEAIPPALALCAFFRGFRQVLTKSRFFRNPTSGEHTGRSSISILRLTALGAGARADAVKSGKGDVLHPLALMVRATCGA